jgi:hypothetical protein
MAVVTFSALTQTMRLPFMSNLRFLLFDVDLPDSPKELDFLLRGFGSPFHLPTTLEHLTCNLTVHTAEPFVQDLRTRDIWTPLDSLVTQLRRVDINIAVYEFNHFDMPLDPVNVDDIRGLVHQKLPMLYAKGILCVDVL